MWFAFARLGSRRFGIAPEKFVWVRRSELGELGARHHYHFLMGGRNIQSVSLDTCFWLMASWEALGGGFARVEPYEPEKNGSSGGASGALAYMLKGLNGGLAYETGKFASMAAQLMLSDGLMKLIHAVLRSDRKFARQSERRWTTAQAVVAPGAY